jgi:hypothetical protein
VTLSRLWAVLAVALPVLGALLASLPMTDLAYQLRAGAQILDGAGIPQVDTWTYTVAGQPWHDQQWGAQVLLAAVGRLGGWTALAVLRAILVGAVFGLVALAARRSGADVRTASLSALLAFAVSAVALALRPQLFALVLFGSLLLLIVERRRQPRLLWLSVPIVAVWANLHGSFFLGPALLGLTWLDDAVNRRPGARWLLVIALVASATALLNPAGLDVWRYALGLSTDRNVTARVTEWQPTDATPLRARAIAAANAMPTGVNAERPVESTVAETAAVRTSPIARPTPRVAASGESSARRPTRRPTNDPSISSSAATTSAAMTDAQILGSEIEIRTLSSSVATRLTAGDND